MAIYVVELSPASHLGTGYMLSSGGMVSAVKDPSCASWFDTREEARNHRPGHDAAMGGSGQKGTVVSLERAEANYMASRNRNRMRRA